MPEHHAYLLNWFNLINRGRPIHEFGFAPLPWVEIDAWARMMRIVPKVWEIDALLRLDRVWLSVMSEKGHPFEDSDDAPARTRSEDNAIASRSAPRRIGSS